MLQCTLSWQTWRFHQGSRRSRRNSLPGLAFLTGVARSFGGELRYSCNYKLTGTGALTPSLTQDYFGLSLKSPDLYHLKHGHEHRSTAPPLHRSTAPPVPVPVGICFDVFFPPNLNLCRLQLNICSSYTA